MDNVIKLSKEDRDARNAEILRLHEAKVPKKEIAEKTGLSVAGVCYALKSMKKAKKAEAPAEEAEISAIAEPAEPIAEPQISAEPDSGAEILRQVEKLKQQMEAQQALAKAATELMLAWKEKYESTMRSQKAAEQLTAMENAYFDALRAVADSTREAQP